MKNILIILAIVAAIAVAASFFLTPDPDEQNRAIAQSVIATINARPEASPYPTFTPYPTQPPLSLNGLYCEYHFCIGHPANVYMFDLKAVQNPREPSTYSSGLLTGYRENIFILLIWEQTPGVNDPQTALNTILGQDQLGSAISTETIGQYPTLYANLQTTQTASLPFGMVAAWQCQDRRFGWKIYTAQDGTARQYLEEALLRMECSLLQ